MNTPAASRAVIARAVAALEAEGKPVAGVLVTAGKAAVALTAEGLLALMAAGELSAGLTAPAPPESSAPSAANDVDLDSELTNWAQDHAPH